MKFSTLVLLSFFFITQLYSQNFNWEWQNSQPYGFSLQHSLILDNGNFLMFGEKSTILKSTDSGLSWERTTPDSAGGMRTIYSASFLNNNTGYFCGAGGMIAKTTDGGATWNFQTSGVTTNLLEISFYDENYGFAGGSSAVLLKTTNGGDTWVKYETGTTSGEVYRIAFAPGTNGATVFVGSGVTTIGRISKSTDSGSTFAPAAGYTSTTAVRGLQFIDANTGYAGNGTFEIYKTTDGGQTFTLSYDPGTGVFYDMRAGTGGVIFAAGSRGEVYKTTDQGATWSFHNSLISATISTIAVKENLIIAAGTGGSMSKSSDTGINWSMMSMTGTIDDIRNITFVTDQTGYAIGGTSTASVIIKTTNGGQTWEKLPFSTTYFTRSQYWLNETTGFVGRRGQYGLFKTTDGGLNFDSVNTGIGTSTQSWNVIAFANADTGYIAGDNGNYCRTTDGGVSWTVLPNNLHHGTGIIYDIAVIDAKTVVSMGGGGRVFKTTDAGQTFTDYSGLGTTSAMYSVDFYGKDLGYLVGSSGRVYKTTNGGANWSYTTPAGSTTLYKVKIISENIIWISGSSGLVFFTTDGGTSWTTSTSFPVSGLTRTMYNMAVKGPYLWVAGSTGTIIKGYSDPIPVEMHSFSASAVNDEIILSWQTATETNNKGFEVEQLINSLWENIGFVNGRGTTTEPYRYNFSVKVKESGIYKFRLKQIDYDGSWVYTSAVEVNTEMPSVYTLEQNFPNPFNPSTAITFAIGSKERVSIIIYDILGNFIKEVINEDKEAGNHTIYLNASDLSSGVYIYRLNAGSYTSARKMMLMK
jgi:photosystem II stability/assembly factor-like uncharacterized protein